MKPIKLSYLLFILLFIACSNDDGNNPILVSNCDEASIIVETEVFNSVDTDTYAITDVELNGDCLEITISDSGCEPEEWEMKLLSTDAFYNIYPRQRAAKLQLINNQECQAVFLKTISFDLTPFQLEGQQTLPIFLEGWDEPIVYEY